MPDYQYPLLKIMLQDMISASPQYRPTSFWQKAVEEIVEDIQNNGIENFRSLTSALKFFVPTYSYPGYPINPQRYVGFYDAFASIGPHSSKLDTRLKWLLSGELLAQSDYRVYLSSMLDVPPYTDQATESDVGNPVEQFNFNGKNFSRSFLNYLLGINFFKKVCKPGVIRNVLEIGGGYGTLGEILTSDSRNDSFYINVDIPPTSFISTYYLEQVLGHTHVGNYEKLKTFSTLNINELRKNYKAIVLCPWQLPIVAGQIDLFVNYISFQEMEPDVVANYLDHVQRLCPRYILLRNLREGKQVAKDSGSLGVKRPILGANYDQFIPGYDLAGTNTIPFGHETEDGFHSELRLYVCRDLRGRS